MTGKSLISILCILTSSVVVSQPLDSLLRIAVENNAELKSLELEYEAELLKLDQVSQLPNPQLGIGVPISPPETRLGPQVVMVGASQMFPWFGTLDAQKNVVLSMSKSKFERISLLKLNLFNGIRVTYYELQFVDQKEQVLDDILQQFQTLKSLAVSNVESGKGSASNVLRVQLKIDELQRSIDELQTERIKLSALMSTYVYLSPDQVITPEADENLPEFVEDVESFRDRIETHYPMIQLLDSQIEASIGRQIVNKKKNAPTIGVGLDYAVVNERTDMNPDHNGRDILVPKVMIKIPLQRKSYRATERQEELIQQSIGYKKEDVVRRVMASLHSYKADYTNAISDIEFIENQIKTTSSIYRLLLTEYSSSGKGFDELLQVQNQFIAYVLDKEKAILEAKIARANKLKYTEF